MIYSVVFCATNSPKPKDIEIIEFTEIKLRKKKLNPHDGEASTRDFCLKRYETINQL